MSNFVKVARKTFKNLFSKHLFVTNTIVGTSLMAAGDGIQQSVEMYQSNFTKPYDWRRTGSMAIVGVGLGALGHGWYAFLERRYPGIKAVTIAKKIGLELLMGIPINTTFIFCISRLEGLSNDKSIQEVKEKFPIMYLVECVAWPPIQFINFYFLHPRYRVLYVSSVMLFWDVFLSYIIHKGRASPEVVETEKNI
ncbi:MPV17L2 (predicted) [Pycnogonum litorale]